MTQWDTASASVAGRRPANEDAVLILPLGDFVMQRAVSEFAAWQADYEYAGLGDPVLGLSTSRGWDRFRAAARAATYNGVRREDDFALTASFLRHQVLPNIFALVGFFFPQDIVDTMKATMAKISANEDFKKKAEDAGLVTTYMDTATYVKHWDQMDAMVKPLLPDLLATAQ